VDAHRTLAGLCDARLAAQLGQPERVPGRLRLVDVVEAGGRGCRAVEQTSSGDREPGENEHRHGYEPDDEQFLHDGSS
jgi:hypothetical protein